MLDWNPNDPDTVKVHYDVSGWSIDQRAELAEALADEDLAHVWEGEELVVPEELEADVDAMFARLEGVLGPFAIPLADDEDGVEFGLDEWPPADRATLAQALIEAGVAHRWDGTTVIAAAAAEAEVDELLDGIEQGTLALAGAEAVAPEDTLPTLFAGADRLAKDPEDEPGRTMLVELVPSLRRNAPPYGLSAAAWTKAMDEVDHLVELLGAADSSSSDIIGAAQQLRSRVREYV